MNSFVLNFLLLFRFTEFTKPVDIEEVPDYLEIISQPMDLETIMVKVNQGSYHSARQFLDDIDLIVSNALNYNPSKTDTDRVIEIPGRILNS